MPWAQAVVATVKSNISKESNAVGEVLQGQAFNHFPDLGPDVLHGDMFSMSGSFGV